ncbi:unnamed protein product [Sphagnum tenellum]
MMNLCSNSEKQKDPKLNQYSKLLTESGRPDVAIVKKLASLETTSRFTTTMATTSSPPRSQVTMTSCQEGAD